MPKRKHDDETSVLEEKVPKRQKEDLLRERLALVFDDANLDIITDDEGETHKLWRGFKNECGRPDQIQVGGKRGTVRRVAYEHFGSGKLSSSVEVRVSCTHPACIVHLVAIRTKQRHTETNDMFAKATDDERLYHVQRILSNTKTTESGCRLWNGALDTDGYGDTWIFLRKIGAHVAILALHLQRAIEKGKLVRHLCGTRSCVEISHLREGTNSENQIDSVQHGTSHATITSEQAMTIYQSKGSGTKAQRARRFGVSIPIVASIDKGIAWAHATGAKKPETVNHDSTLPFAFDYTVAVQSIESNVTKDVNTQCWHWNGYKTSHGYGRMRWKGRNHFVHRLAFYAFHRRPIPPESKSRPIILHRCVSKCVNPDHLSEGSHVQNMADKKRDGTNKNPRTKITAELAKQIAASKRHGTRKERAKRFGVTTSTVTNIDFGQSWKNAI